jgi:hypothetical protein
VDVAKKSMRALVKEGRRAKSVWNTAEWLPSLVSTSMSRGDGSKDVDVIG